MKRIIIILFLVITMSPGLSAQSQEAQQLLLNVEKLAQLKQILSDLKKGYQIVSSGYNNIRNISRGNFNLHQAFLEGLLQVSPAVRNYKKVADIIHYQVLIVKEYKNAFRRFKQDNNYNPQELDYIGKVYANLFNQSLKNIDALVTVLTANKLRMSDEERLKTIDGIFDSMNDKLAFLRDFNNNTIMLSIARAKEKNDANSVQKIYGITH